MSLFLADHTPAKIMILGRWSSDAFLVYIRPQVMEWTNNMSEDMIGLDSYWDLAKPFSLSNEAPPTAQKEPILSWSDITSSLPHLSSATLI